MKKKVEVKPQIDQKEVDFFIDRLVNILLMQLEQQPNLAEDLKRSEIK